VQLEGGLRESGPGCVRSISRSTLENSDALRLGLRPQPTSVNGLEAGRACSPNAPFVNPPRTGHISPGWRDRRSRPTPGCWLMGTNPLRSGFSMISRSADFSPLFAPHRTRSGINSALRARSWGFSMIELIGVLAVIAVLAAVLVPTVIRRIDRSAWTKETTDLNSIADSYMQYILRNKTIPGTNTWASSVANQMSLPVSAITTNSRRYARAFLVDPSLSIGGAGLPYTQTTNGAVKPVSARVMIVSSLGRALPISTGIPSAADFTNIGTPRTAPCPPRHRSAVGAEAAKTCASRSLTLSRCFTNSSSSTTTQ